MWSLNGRNKNKVLIIVVPINVQRNWKQTGDATLWEKSITKGFEDSAVKVCANPTNFKS